MSTHIHQQVSINAKPQDVYQAFMSEKHHSALTGGASRISTEIGGSVEMHDGQITARNLELELGRKIVQAWRVAGWEEGLYTLLRIKLEAEGAGTLVTLDQSGCPEEMTEHLAGGWHERYWKPMAAHFSTNGG